MSKLSEKELVIYGCEQVGLEAALEAIEGRGCSDVLWKIIVCHWAKNGESLAPQVFVACLGITREGLAEEHSVLMGLSGTRRDDM